MKNRLRRRSLALAVLAAACIVVLGIGTAGAFVLFGQSWAYQAKPMGEPWEICTKGMPAGAAKVLRRAAAAWNYKGFRFTFRSNRCSSGGQYPRLNEVNQIDFGPGLGGSVLAQNVMYFRTKGGEAIECDMRFNSAQPWHVGTGRAPKGKFDLFSVAVHEFGHCLGLNHSNLSPPPVMFPSIGPGVHRRDLLRDDIRGRNALYGR